MDEGLTEVDEWFLSVVQEPTWQDIYRRFEDSSRPKVIGDKEAKTFFERPYFLRHLISMLITSYTKEFPAKLHMDIDFPGTRVQKDGVTYGIHGINHDDRMRALLLSTFSDIPEGAGVMLETSLKNLYPINGGHSQSRLSEYQFASDDFLHGIEKHNLMVMIMDAKPRPQVKRMNDFIDDRTVTKWNDGRMTIDNLLLPDHLARTFPEFVLSNADTPKKRYEAGLLLRSLAQSYFMQEVAQKSEATQVHAIVGLAHEQDIAIFLRHPDIADELAAKYSPTGAYVPSAVFDRAVLSEQRVCHNLNYTYPRVLFPLIIAASSGFFLALGAMQLQDAEPAGYASCGMGIVAGAVATWMYRALRCEFNQIGSDLINHER